MGQFEHADSTIHYDLEGLADGEPLLMIAPGGLRSTNDKWTTMPYNPRVELAERFRLIGMDQRNAGASVGPVDAERAWQAYTDDQLALLDHLEIERCSLIGMCIGGPYILSLLKRAPERFDRAVLLQPVGLTDENRPMFDDITDEWSGEIAVEVDEATLDAFKQNMWYQPFVGSVTEDDVAAIETPMLVMMGNDAFHPSETSRRVAELAPDCAFVERWKDDDVLTDTRATIAEFFA